MYKRCGLPDSSHIQRFQPSNCRFAGQQLQKQVCQTIQFRVMVTSFHSQVVALALRILMAQLISTTYPCRQRLPVMMITTNLHCPHFFLSQVRVLTFDYSVRISCGKYRTGILLQNRDSHSRATIFEKSLLFFSFSATRKCRFVNFGISGPVIILSLLNDCQMCTV